MSNTARSVHDEFIFETIRRVFSESKRRLERTKSLESLFTTNIYDNQRFRNFDDDDDDNNNEYDDGFWDIVEISR